VSLRRETIFRDWAIGSNSSRDLWIACSSSRVDSSRSIRRLIVCGNLLDRRRMGRDVTLLSAESRYVGVQSVRSQLLHKVGGLEVAC
jgi:hypothetical protein